MLYTACTGALSITLVRKELDITIRERNESLRKPFFSKRNNSSRIRAFDYVFFSDGSLLVADLETFLRVEKCVGKVV